MKLIFVITVAFVLCICFAKENASSFLKNIPVHRSGERFWNENIYSSQQVADGDQGICFMRHNHGYVNLNNQNWENSLATLHVPKVTGAASLNFKLCRNQEAKNKCAVEGKSGLILIDTASDCKVLAGDWNVDKIWDFKKYSEMESTISLQLPPGEICNPKTNQTYQYTVNLRCAWNETYQGSKGHEYDIFVVQDKGPIDVKSCNNTINVNTYRSCPKFYMASGWGLVFMNKYILTTIFLAIGALLIFLGKKIFDYLLIGLTAFMGSFMIRGLLYQWIILNPWICFGIGVGLAVLVFFYRNLSTFFLAAIFGYIITSTLFILVWSLIPSFNPYILFYALLVLIIIALFAILVYIQNILEVIVTSLVGAYFLVRGCSFLIGGFPDEFFVALLIQTYETGQLNRLINGKVIIYFIAYCLVFLVGLLFQIGYFLTGETGENNEEKNAKEGDAEEKAKLNAQGSQ